MKARGWGLGPVFAFEWLLTSRRPQVYALRSGFLAVILIALWLAWNSAADSVRYRPINRVMAEMGQTLFYTFACVQLAIVMVTAPGATAGAICLDRARGTLMHLLMTDLTDSEIVLGKLASRLAPMIGLIFCGLPVMALLTLMGGIDPVQLTGTFLISLGVTVLGCSLALLLSVWAGKAHEVVMAVYLIWLGWLLALPIGIWAYQTFFGVFAARSVMTSWFAKANPVWILLGPSSNIPIGTPDFADQVIFFVAVLVISAALVVLATFTVRWSSVRSEGKAERKARAPRLGFIRELRHLMPAPRLDWNPVLWREWTRSRPSRWSLVIWWTYGLAACFFSGLVVFHRLVDSSGWREMPAVINVIQVGVGLLLLSVTASTSLVEERVRGSLDVLMTTPLTTLSIVAGKWLGAYRRAVTLAVLPGFVAVGVALTSGKWYGAFLVFASVLAQGAGVVSFGLLMATLTPRLGRAIGLTVGAYIFVAIGWFFILVLLFPRGGGDWPRLLGPYSPLYNAGALTECIERYSSGTWEFETLLSATFWVFVHTAIAIVLFLVTYAEFDHRLGRLTGANEPRWVHYPAAPKILMKSELVEMEIT